jgi:hypothetical protein
VKPFATPTTSAPTKVNRAAIAKALAKAAADLDRTAASPPPCPNPPRVETETVAVESDESEEYENFWLQDETTVPTSPNPPEATIRVTANIATAPSHASSSGVTRSVAVATTEQIVASGWFERVGEISNYREGHWLKPLSAHKDRHNLVGNIRHFVGRSLPEGFGIDGTPSVHVAQFEHVLSYLSCELAFLRGLAFEVQPACTLPHHFGLHAQLSEEIRQLGILLREEHVLPPPLSTVPVPKQLELFAGKL